MNPPEGVIRNLSRLTGRELEVLRLMLSNNDYRTISERLGVTVSTIKAYAFHIYNKLELRNAHYAERRRLLFEVYGPALSTAELPAAESGDLAQLPPRVFICHAQEDTFQVVQLHKALKLNGVQAWLDAVDLLPGQDWELEIARVIRNCDFFLACLSTHAINKRGYVQKELRMGLEMLARMPPGEIFLIPARLEVCAVPVELASRHWVDLFSEGGFDLLLRAVFSRRA